MEHLIEIERLVGVGILPYLDELARLRMEVFREFPYLYDGSESYERSYLEEYAGCARAVCIVAKAEGRVIGASTGMPLADAIVEFRQPFEDAGIPVEPVFYLGESVLEQAFRGRGMGGRFFDEREAHARSLGYTVTAFCAVERGGDHPLRPEGYRGNDSLWRRRGYRWCPELRAQLEWKQIDSPEMVENTLSFWVRDLPDSI